MRPDSPAHRLGPFRSRRRGDPDNPDAPEVPEPSGREVDHDGAGRDAAAARPDTALSRWLPEPAGAEGAGWLSAVRADPGRAGVVALAVVGVLAVLVTVFTLLRDPTPPVMSAKLPAVEMVSAATSAPAAPDPAVVVSVVGLVHTPGLVTLASGARVADALEAAGGPVDGADLMGLNMARRLADGEQIVVGIAPTPGRVPAMGSSVSAPADPPAPTDSAAESAGPVDLNAATVEQLDALPGVGPVTAGAIVAWRDASGPFVSVDQLAEVDGIGPARLDKLRERVRV